MRRVLLVAGEASGDLHAANLFAALRRLSGAVEGFGLAGERMREAGITPLATTEELSVMGLTEVLRELPRLLRLSRRFRRAALAGRPDVAVLVDSPDFNLPLARALRRRGVPAMIYISPQLWAWRAGRVRRIRRDVRKVLAILPFEVPFYESRGVNAEYVGHPLVDELQPLLADPPEREEGTVALLPGSRWHEVRSLLPVMVEAMYRVRGRRPGLRARLVVAPGLDRERVRAALGEAAGWVELVAEKRHCVLASSTAALVASGTATLECALLGVPMVVGYRLHAGTYMLARHLVRVPFVSLVNLVAGRRVVPELIQNALSPAAAAAALESLLGSAGAEQREGLAEVRDRLGPPGASERAASAILEVLG